MAFGSEALYTAKQQDSGDSSRDMTAKPPRIETLIFGGGMDRGRAPAQLEPGKCRYLENFYFPKECGSPTMRGGLQPWSAGTALPGKITNMCVYEKSPTTSYVVVSCYDSPTSPTTQELHYYDEGNDVWVQIEDDLGSLVAPTFKTMNARLVIAVVGQYLRQWDGDTTVPTLPTVPLQASKAITFNFDEPTHVVKEGDWITAGGQTWTFYATRTQPGEIAIPSPYTDTAQAANVAAAINDDAWDIKATADTGVLTITARRYGTVGNSYPLEFSFADGNSHITGATSPTTLAGGVAGMILSTIDTREAPKTGIISGDKNGRMIYFGDDTNKHRLGFSAPGNEWSWASGDYGEGEWIDIAAEDGNLPSAAHPFNDEIWCHKTGQNREIYRIRVADPNPETWDVKTRPINEASCALSQRCATSTVDKHLILDRDYFGAYRYSDVGSEVVAGIVGNAVPDLLLGADSATAFMVKIPTDGCVLVFPEYGDFCLVFHYASERWASFRFRGHSISCGEYHEGLRLMLFGAADGHVYFLDPSSSDDGDTPIIGTAISRTIYDPGMQSMNILETALGYRPVVEGEGYVAPVVDGNEAGATALFSYLSIGSTYIIDQAPGVIDDYAAVLAATNQFGRVKESYECIADQLAIKVVQVSGSIIIDDVTLRIASWGRSKQ